MDVTHASPAVRQSLRKSVQMVFQNPYGSLNPRKKIGAILEAPLAINTPLTAAQRQVIDTHAAQSAQLLSDYGIGDTDWLEAVRDHHTQTPGPLRARTAAQQYARLIQRADMFAARLAPRAGRSPIRTVVLFFDEAQNLQEEHYHWLLNVSNEVEARGFRVFCLLVGQHALSLHATRLLDADPDLDHAWIYQHVRGDLFCKVMVETPVKLSSEQKELLRKFESSLKADEGRHTPREEGFFEGVKRFFTGAEN